MPRVSAFSGAILFLLCWITSVHAAQPVQLTDSPYADRHPTWSADGLFIVFESNRSGDAWHLYRVAASGGEATQLSFASSSQLAPEISPDGTQIVYIQADASVSGGTFNSSAICLLPVGGGAVTTLVADDGGFRWHPTWTPDGSTIYFTRRVATPGTWDLYKVSSAGGPETLVLDFYDDGTSIISPDGQTITWANHGPGQPYNLWQVARTNPVNPVQLTFETANTAQPAYAWDGSKIAYVSRKVLGKLDVFEIQLSNKAITRLTFDAENSPFDPLNQYPTYSRDDTRLAFSSARIDGNENIWVLPLVDTPPPPENSLQVEDGRGLPGPGTVTVPVRLASNTATPALEFELTDTPDWLHVVGVTPRGRAAGLTASFSDAAGVHVVLYGASGSLLQPGTGPILDLTVVVRPEATEGATAALEFSNIVMANKDGDAVPVTSEGGTFFIGRLDGDVNGDNQVDGGDLVRLVEIILGTGAPSTAAELGAADCNNDGDQNALDIVCILNDVLSKPSMVGFAAIPPGVWTIKADEPVLGFQGLLGENTSLATGWEASPFQLHQDAASLIAFDALGAPWSPGVTRTWQVPAPIGLKAFGTGGRSLPVRIQGNEIHIGTPIPAGFHVLPASPNPFARSTEIAFSVDHPTSVRINVYDVRGAKVAGMAERAVTAGRQVWRWSALDDRGQPLPSGLYLAVVEAGSSRSVVRLAHLR